MIKLVYGNIFDSIEYITSGIDYIERNYKKWKIESIAVPPLGCGNGGLDWKFVDPILYRKFKKLDIYVEIYIPF